jgi:hypothetical protein
MWEHPTESVPSILDNEKEVDIQIFFRAVIISILSDTPQP